MGLRQGAVEDLGMTTSFWAGKTVLVTGHTGFKGGWLSLWLQQLGAKVIGFALPPDTRPSLFEMAGIEQGMVSVFGDVRDLTALHAVMEEHQPQIVFHLAAQPLVRHSYTFPVETYATNVMGTVHLLDAVRTTNSVRVCQVITSDKCYENREWDFAYRENDRLGGHDPYSNSKACAELVAAAYRDSFFTQREGFSLATVRAGNVIGGGDWAKDRIIPDCIRSIECGEPIVLRNPGAIRPWQHVLEPLSGYLWLAQKQWLEPQRFAGAWNFGPGGEKGTPVSDLVEQVIAAWGSGSWRLHEEAAKQPHEAGILKLDITKTNTRLDWYPAYGVPQAVKQTVAWYKLADQPTDSDHVRALCHDQIAEYVGAAAQSGSTWTAA